MAFVRLCFLLGMLGMTYAKENYITEETVLHENVLFYKDGEMSLSRSRWMLTFVLDINVYEGFLKELAIDIGNASKLVDLLSKHYEGSQLAGYRSTFKSMQEELRTLEPMNLEIMNNFIGLKSLGGRSRRGIFNFVGNTMSFLFGTLSEADLNDIRANLGTLASNQQEISHVLEKSLSLLNMTRVQVAENRRTINEVIDSVGEIDNELRAIRKQLSQAIYELQQFVHIFAKLDLMIEKFKTAIQRSTYYFLQLQVQINALSMQKLTPDTIEPKELRKVLQDIETQLPKAYGLPANPETELWSFYKLLTCNTMMVNNSIIIVVTIP